MITIYVAALLVGIGIFLLYFLDRDIDDNKLYIALFTGIATLIGGVYLLFYSVPTEVIRQKVIGFILVLAGFWMVFKFPSAMDYQPEGMGLTGVLIGLVLLILGLYWFIF